MATIQAKTSRGQKYWYIVESRRVNGKPRPIVLAYLGKADKLLKRLQGMDGQLKLKSYSHGAIAALLNVAAQLEIPSIINKYVKSPRSYMSRKPQRNQLTVGVTLLLGAMGRVCMPTSKRGWWNWAKTTSCEYLLRCALSRIDSQHFWDLMDALPVEAIPKIEAELLQKVQTHYPLEHDTLLFDTTNFFTFIASTNQRCTIAQRGKNKQKRHDLRQVGLALVVTRKDSIPLFHLSYQGNLHDSKVFHQVIGDIKKRMIALNFDLEKHTLVFDRGNNSKKNLAVVAKLKLHYLGALVPYQHQTLLEEAQGHYQAVVVNDEPLDVYRAKNTIWGQPRTVLVFVSDRLKAGQLRGILQALARKEKELRKIQQALLSPQGATRDRTSLEERIAKLLKGQFLDGLIQWSLSETADKQIRLDFSIDQKQLAQIEQKLGFRILMTDRDDWDTGRIIETYYSQATVEEAFKNIKNPHHLALKPQFHWTDQKLIVHNFMCVVGYLLSTLLWKEARQKAGFTGTLDSLLTALNNIRLATLIEQPKGRGRPKAIYKLEEMSEEELALINALDVAELHKQRPKLKGVGVYN